MRTQALEVARAAIERARGGSEEDLRLALARAREQLRASAATQHLASLDDQALYRALVAHAYDIISRS
jgi:hypothetical protein